MPDFRLFVPKVVDDKSKNKYLITKTHSNEKNKNKQPPLAIYL